MKIRCGSHQQNRSIVRPGLSLMATKVALTAEEFRENSQRSIALFNTEKLSTDSTHVLKSAYCILCISAVAICTGRVEAKYSAVGMSALGYRCNLHGACGGKEVLAANNVIVPGCNLHGACGGKVVSIARSVQFADKLQSARGVWRQRPHAVRCAPPRKRCNLHGACGGKEDKNRSPCLLRRCNLHGACGGKGAAPQISHAGLWRCNLHGACGGKEPARMKWFVGVTLQSARGVWRQSCLCYERPAITDWLQSARGVWRQRIYRILQMVSYKLQSARGVWRQSMCRWDV